MAKSMTALSFLFLVFVLSMPNASASADIFVGELKPHELAGHANGIYIPTSYTGIAETYTLNVRNDKNFATTEVQVILPKGMQLISAEKTGSWKVTVLEPPSVPTQTLIWNGSSISKGSSEQFVFKVRNPSDLFVYYFVVVQSYEGGENDVWRPWVQVINPTNIAGVEISTIAAAIIPIALALPVVERAFSAKRKS